MKDVVETKGHRSSYNQTSILEAASFSRWGFAGAAGGAETQMFLLKLRRPTAASLKAELERSGGVRAIIITAITAQHWESFTLLGWWQVCLCVCVCDEAVFDFRCSAKTATHTCAEVIWCERQHACSRFLSSTWQFGLRSGKTVSPQGSITSHLPGESHHSRRLESCFSFRCLWNAIW